jgi:hypothetical protein
MAIRLELRVRWTERLSEISKKPLACCANFPEIAERWEAWWRFDADRPLLVGAVPDRRAAPDLRRDKLFDLLGQPDRWLELRQRQMEHTCWIDQAVPHVRVDIGPVATAAFVGAPLHFAPAEDTAWLSPLMNSDEWDFPAIDAGSGILAVTLELARRAAKAGAGRFLVAVPDLSGPPDVLAALRGTERLLLDLVDRPTEVRRASGRLVESWEVVFTEMYDAILTEGAGPSTWLFAWSSVPYTVPTCDFNAMIGPAQFNDLCLPPLEEQARRAGRCLFHLDGPDAARHAPALCRSPAISAIQFTPGAGTPSALARIAMLAEIQSAGKPVLVICPASEVAELCRRLDRRGLAVWPDGLATPEQARELERACLATRR